MIPLDVVCQMNVHSLGRLLNVLHTYINFTSCAQGATKEVLLLHRNINMNY